MWFYNIFDDIDYGSLIVAWRSIHLGQFSVQSTRVLNRSTSDTINVNYQSPIRVVQKRCRSPDKSKRP